MAATAGKPPGTVMLFIHRTVQNGIKERPDDSLWAHKRLGE